MQVHALTAAGKTPVSLPLTSPEQARLYREKGYWRDKTLAELFLEASEGRGDKIALIEKGRRFTYAQFADLVDRLAGGLVSLGLAPGDVVAMQWRNGVELPLLHLACNRAGFLYMPLHDSWRELEVRHLLQTAKARVLIVPGVYRDFDHGAMALEVQRDLPELRHLFALTETVHDLPAFDTLLSGKKLDREALDTYSPDPDAPAHIMLSGGTTALSKISRFSSNDLMFMMRSIAETGAFDENSVAAALAPAGTGATGYLYPLLMPLMYGATGVVLERWGDPEEAIALIAEHRCTHATGIPSQLTKMSAVLDRHDASKFEAFHCFTNAGAPLPYETAVAIERQMSCRVQSAYGATDGGVPAVTALTDPDEKRLRTVGRIVEGVECEIRNPDDGKALPAGEAGEVVWRSPDKSWGYLGDDTQTALAFTDDHFYKSGDLGVIDNDGYLRITGRIKDMILRGGRNISPQLIEEHMAKHPAVLDVAVAAMPDKVLGERACAFVILRAGCTLDFDGVVEFLKGQKLAIWQLPERLKIIDDFPRGVGGKVLKKELTAMIGAELRAEGEN